MNKRTKLPEDRLADELVSLVYKHSKKNKLSHIQALGALESVKMLILHETVSKGIEFTIKKWAFENGF